jgi:uncharacterized protein (TIGR00369 family)
MTDVATLRELLAAQPMPVCARLTPFQVVDAELDAGFVVLSFDQQPAFSNHWGNVQGGFGVAMIDVLVSIAVFGRLRQWCPTVEIKSSFLAPAKIGRCKGEARVLKVGSSLAFVEASLWDEGGELAIRATATVSVRQD